MANTELTEFRETALSAVSEMHYYPAVFDEKIQLENRMTIPFSQIGALGTTFKPVAQVFQNVFKNGGAGGSGFYWVDVAPGTHLAQKHANGKFISSSLSNATNQVSANADMTFLPCDPTMLFMAMALMSIDKKLDEIKAMQKEILEFMQQKERAKQRGNLIFLNDILHNFKYNFENATYRSNHHIKVLDIRQESEQSILFYREQIEKRMAKQSLLHGDRGVKQMITSVKIELVEYQLALYLYAFSSFLEIMLLGNYESAYLEDIMSKIKDYSLKYRELYTTCYNTLEQYSKSSIQSHLLSGLASASKTVGTAVNKIPVISNSQIDENLISAGERMGKMSESRTENALGCLVSSSCSHVQPFVDNILLIYKLYNEPVEMLFDNENLYLSC